MPVARFLGATSGAAHARQIRVPLNEAEQRAIAHILGELDDKIELNRQMSETLEAMARALFKSWFVDFDPVRAKMEGRAPGLPKPLADLFPDSLVDSELGEVLEGWEVKSLDQTAQFVNGLALQKYPPTGGLAADSSSEYAARDGRCSITNRQELAALGPTVQHHC